MFDFFRNLYQSTYKIKDFRKVMFYTRIIGVLLEILFVVFLINLFIFDFMTYNLYVFAVFVFAIIGYFSGFFLVLKEYRLVKEVNLTLPYIYYYLVFEALILGLLIIILL